MTTARQNKEMNNGLFVLENANGELVRSFRWESTKVAVVYRKDNRRVETFASVKELEEREIPFELIAETTPAQLRKKALQIKGIGQIRWVEEAGRMSHTPDLAPEQGLEPKKLWGWSVGLQMGLLSLFVIAGLFSGESKEKAQEHTVTLIPQQAIDEILRKDRQDDAEALKSRIEQMAKKQEPVVQEAAPQMEKQVAPPAKLAKKVVVAPSEKKIAKNAAVPTRSTSMKKSARVSRTGRLIGGGYKGEGPRGYGTNEPDMNQIGALGALNSAPRVKGGNGGRGGLNLQAVGTEPGSGAGGKGFGGFGNNGGGGRGKGGLGAGKGMGLSNAMYGRGLIAAPFGDGSPAPGSGGYGTRGRAGGGAQGAGYGETTIAGSWKGTGPKGIGPAGSGAGNGREYGSPDGFAEGDEEDVLVQGGLDRDQIAAVIMRHLGQITYCYEQGLQKQPALAGRVAVRFQIGGQGRVQTAGVSHSSLRSSQVESCIVGKLKTWMFPKPHGGVNVAVTYPFILRRVSQR